MTTLPDIHSPWLKLAEVCGYSRCGRTTVITALKSGELKGNQVTKGGMWRVHRDDVDAWLRGEPPVSTVERVTRRSPCRGAA